MKTLISLFVLFLSLSLTSQTYTATWYLNDTSGNGIQSPTSTATGDYSTAMGRNTIASGLNSTAMGWGTEASGANSTAMGEFSRASGEDSIAMGDQARASGGGSIAMGTSTKANGANSTAMGNYSTANGSYSVAMGYNSQADGLASFSSGLGSKASGNRSTAMGGSAEASGNYSTALGFETSATAERSTAMGAFTTASGLNSTAMGWGTTASGIFSTAIGSNSTASGEDSIAMGLGTIASGKSSTAMGEGTTASDRSSLVIGEYNLSGSTVTSSATLFNLDNTAFVIGNGFYDESASQPTRSDAFTVWFNGDATLAGNLNINSDARLKANIVSLGSTLSKLLQIDGKSYTMKKDESEKQKIGLLAQDIEKVFPELVSESNGVKSVNYQGLVPVLINALKEQQAEIDRLQKPRGKTGKIRRISCCNGLEVAELKEEDMPMV